MVEKHREYTPCALRNESNRTVNQHRQETHTSMQWHAMSINENPQDLSTSTKMLPSDLESEIGDLPYHSDPDIQSFRRRQWASRLARVCWRYWLPWQPWFKCVMTKHHVQEKERGLLCSVIFYTQYADYLPVDAPDIVAKVVAKIGRSSITSPIWCNKSGDTYRRLWLATLLMGAGGRPFAFATTRMAEAFNLASKNTVTRFLNAAKGQGYIKVVREGIARPLGGQAALYKLSNVADCNKWQLLPNIETISWLPAIS